MTHPFEAAGLGIAPFKFIGLEVRKFQAAPGEPVKPGASCDYCGTEIMNCCIIVDSRGLRFKVGTECVRKSGDAHLKKKVAQEKTKKAKELAVTRIARALEKLPIVEESLKSIPHPKLCNSTMYEYVVWMMNHAGNAGKIKVAKIIEETVV